MNWLEYDQHTIMKTNDALIMQRFNTLKGARPELSDDAIRRVVMEVDD